MMERTLEQEVVALRAEVSSLKEQLAKALAVIAQLQRELEKHKSEPPSFVKPNTPKSKDKAQKQPRLAAYYTLCLNTYDLSA